MTVARLQHAADQLARSNLGYDQGDRWSFFNRKTLKVKTGAECDCSSSCGAIAAMAGYPLDLSDPFWTGNFASKLTATGLFKAIAFTGRLDQLRPGDFLLGPGHVIFVRDSKRWWSAESDERGQTSGGKPGNQTRVETRYRAPYKRSRGWTTIVRLISPNVLLRQAIVAYANGKKPAEPLRLLSIRSPWDGPRWAWMLGHWAAWDQGVALTYDPAKMAVPTAKHVFIVLGSVLQPSGFPSEKFRQRLDLAARALKLNPKSKVLVTGGAPRNGKTEAAAGRRWLIGAGIEPSRILIEDKSSSTIGNAVGSVPLLLKAGLTRYTLVSHASHLRRAQVLFLAARVQLETVDNLKTGLSTAGLLAIDDYEPKSVKPSLPVTPATRRAIADEVLQLLGLGSL